MKREKAIKDLKIERPRRAVVSEKEALKRMHDFSKRKEPFLATANNRLARESAKLDKTQEQELADEGLASEAKEWLEY
jgi:aminoglycoside phosphotransferase